MSPFLRAASRVLASQKVRNYRKEGVVRGDYRLPVAQEKRGQRSWQALDFPAKEAGRG